MKIEATESFNESKISNASHFKNTVLNEVAKVISLIDADSCLEKESKEKTMVGKILYAPTSLNELFKEAFTNCGWEKARLNYHYHPSLVNGDFKLVVGAAPKKPSKMSLKKGDEPHISAGYDEVDFYKSFSDSLKVSVEVQFGKYFAMTRDNFYKSHLFFKRGISDVCISICPMQHMMKKMSTGIGFYEKSIFELKSAEVSHPLVVIGISP